MDLSIGFGREIGYFLSLSPVSVLTKSPVIIILAEYFMWFFSTVVNTVLFVVFCHGVITGMGTICEKYVLLRAVS